MKPQALTPVAFVLSLLQAYARYQVDPAPALARAQISAAELIRPGATVSARQFEILAGHAMQELDDEALGWFSRRLPWGSYGMLLRASLSAANLGLALQRWCRHHGLLSDDIRLSLTIAQGHATVQFQPRSIVPEALEFCLVTLMRNLHGVACWLVDSRIPLSLSRFPFARPPHAAVYALLFPGPVEFDADCACLEFDAAYLAMALRRDDQALNTMLPRALNLIVRPYRRDRLLVQRVRAQLLLQPGATAGALALALGLSLRSLHRQLAEEGASLQALKDEVRQQQAEDALRRTQRPVKQIARLAGFSNDKSFSRAFRQWTGLSPAAYRRQQ